MKLLIIRNLPSRPLVVLAGLTLFLAYASVHNMMTANAPHHGGAASSAHQLIPKD